MAKNWDWLKEKVSGTASEWSKSVDGMKKKLSELEEKKVKVGIDLEAIDTLKAQIREVEAAVEAVNKLRGMQTDVEKAVGKNVTEAFASARNEQGKLIGGQEMLGKLTAAILPDMEKFSDPFKQANDELNKAQAAIKLEQDMVQKGVGWQIRHAEEFNKATGEASDCAYARCQVYSTGSGRFRGQLRRDAETEVGRMMSSAEHGSGMRQEADREQLARLSRRADLGTVADQLTGQTRRTRNSPISSIATPRRRWRSRSGSGRLQAQDAEATERAASPRSRTSRSNSGSSFRKSPSRTRRRPRPNDCSPTPDGAASPMPTLTMRYVPASTRCSARNSTAARSAARVAS